MGKIFYIMGKSASGKDKLYGRILEEMSSSLSPMVIYTTRPMRSGEVDAETYHFTDLTALKRFRAEGLVIEERLYHTVRGDWYYFTAKDCFPDLDKRSYLGIGTLESYVKMKEVLGNENIIPLYIEVDDNIRLRRALTREEKEARPDYREMCRRFLTDSEDFSDEKLAAAGIEHRFSNNGTFDQCLESVEDYIRNMLY